MARVLGVVRLSRERNDSTSVTRQRTAISAWAKANDHKVVGWAEDVDVSGSVAPWDRPGLGAWKARADEFDVLACWRLDRISRRVLHLAGLIDWCREHEKTLASTAEGLDLDSPMGRVVTTIIGALAEGELEAIRDRTASSFRHLMRAGRWRGGVIPYGYRPARKDDGAGWRLEIDPETGATMREIVRRTVDEGWSVPRLCRWLNAEGVPTPLDAQRIRVGKEATGSEWRPASLRRMLKSQAMLGYAEMTETIRLPNRKTEQVTRIVRGDDGLPLQRAEPLVSRDDWERVQASFDIKKRAHNTARRGASLLLRVAFCGECGEALYHARNRDHYYYRCGTRAQNPERCDNLAIRADHLEAAVIDMFLGFAGDLPIIRRVLVPGEDRSGELADVERAIGELMADRAAGLYSSEAGTKVFREMLSTLETRAEALRKHPTRADEWVEEPTGETYAERWASLDTDEERNGELRSAAVRVVVFREVVRTPSLFGDEPDEGTRAVIEIPDDIKVRGRAVIRVNPSRKRNRRSA